MLLGSKYLKKLQSDGRLVQVMSNNVHIIPPHSLRLQPFKGMMPCDCSLMLRSVIAQVQTYDSDSEFKPQLCYVTSTISFRFSVFNVYSGCCKRIPQIKWLIRNRILFLMVAEARTSRIKVPSKPMSHQNKFLVHRSLSSHKFSHSRRKGTNLILQCSTLMM